MFQNINLQDSNINMFVLLSLMLMAVDQLGLTYFMQPHDWQTLFDATFVIFAMYLNIKTGGLAVSLLSVVELLFLCQ